MYFSLVSTSWTVPRVQGRSRSVLTPPVVQRRRDLTLDLALVDELPVHPPHDLDLFGRSGHEDDPVGLEALVLAPGENALGRAALVDAHASQAVARHPALAVSVLDESALACEHLCGELAAVLCGHGAFDALHDRGYRRPVVDELLGAVVHLDPCVAAGELVRCALVGVLEPAPAAYVVDEDGVEIDVALLDVMQQLLKPMAVLELQAALRVVGVGAHQIQIVTCGVSPDDRHLVVG